MQLPEITKENVDSFDAFRTALIDQLEELAAMTTRYPVECHFRGLRFVFTSREDIVFRIDQLRDDIEAVRLAA